MQLLSFQTNLKKHSGGLWDWCMEIYDHILSLNW